MAEVYGRKESSQARWWLLALAIALALALIIGFAMRG
jgi:hypothetical protein